MTKNPLTSDNMPREFYNDENIFGFVQVLEFSTVHVSLKEVKVRAIMNLDDFAFLEFERVNALVFYLVDLDLWMDRKNIRKQGSGGRKAIEEPRLKEFNRLKGMMFGSDCDVEYVHFEGHVRNERHQLKITWN